MAVTASSISSSNTLEQLRTQFNNLVTDVTGLEAGSQTFTLITSSNITVAEDGTIVFEGATNDDNETTLTVVDPTADRTITLPNASGTVIISDSSTNVTTLPDDLLIKDGGTIGNASVADVMTLASTGIVTFKDDILIKDGGTIGSASDADAITIAANGQLTLTQTLIGTALDISGDIDVDGTTNLDVVDIDGAVDMASTLQVDGSITSSAAATITVADNSAGLTIVSTDADGNSGPQMNFSRASGSPADDDYIGRMNFIGRNDAGQDFVGVDVLTRINDVTDGTEDASFFITTMENGSQVSKMEFLPGETVFNQGGASVDFKVEGDTDANNLVVDASGDRVGIGVAAPASKLEISAGVNSHGLLRLDDTDAGNLGGYMQFDSNGTNKANVQNANNAGIHICVGTGGSVTFTALGYTAANALDDYEEGTWSAALRGESGTEPGSSSVTSAVYVKVGQLVHIECRLTLGTDNGGSGLELTGLPFVTTNAVLFHVAETAQFGVVGILFSNGQIAAGSGHVTFREGNGSSAWQTGTYVQRGSGQYTIVGTYRTTS